MMDAVGIDHVGIGSDTDLLAAVATGIFCGMTPLERDPEKSLLDLYENGSRIGYRAARFKRMLDRKGGVASVKHLLAGNLKGESGFIRQSRHRSSCVCSALRCPKQRHDKLSLPIIQVPLGPSLDWPLRRLVEAS
jgi:hypothetical protein